MLSTITAKLQFLSKNEKYRVSRNFFYVYLIILIIMVPNKAQIGLVNLMLIQYAIRE